MKNIYVVKNNLTKSYSDPIFKAECFDDVCRYNHNFMLLHPDKAQEDMINISTIEYIGTYDDATGSIMLFEAEAIQSYNMQDSWNQIKALEVRGNA